MANEPAGEPRFSPEALRGAQAVVAGMQPGVAFAMAQLGLELPGSGTALDVDGGLSNLRRQLSRSADGG